MIVEVWDYDTYKQPHWETPISERTAQAIISHNQAGPKLEVVRTEKRSEYKDYFRETKSPEAYVDADGNPALRWVENPEYQAAWLEWTSKGTDHKKSQSYLSRKVDVPIYGYRVDTLDDFITVTRNASAIDVYDMNKPVYRMGV